MYEAISRQEISEREKRCIEIDLERTRPELEPEQREKLRKILTAVSNLNKDTGYCQGLNYLSAIVLYTIPNDETVFWIVIQLLKQYDYNEFYTPGMKGLLDYFTKIQILLSKHCPKLSHFFEKHCIMPNTYAMKWALTMFASQSSIENVSVIMDLFLQIGWDAILYISLALLSHFESNLIEKRPEDALVELDSIPVKFNLNTILSIAEKFLKTDHKIPLNVIQSGGFKLSGI